MLPEAYWKKNIIFKYKKFRAQVNIKTAKFSDLKKMPEAKKSRE